MKVELIPIRFPFVKKRGDLVSLILKNVADAGEELRDGDILAIADKIVAVVEGRVVDYGGVKPSAEAASLAEKYDLEPGFTELVLREAEKIYGGVKKAILTRKNGVLIANAGIDHKNVPEMHAALWPSNPHETARKIRLTILEKTGRRVGVVLVDSRVSPLRKGTVGVATGFSGFKPVIDFRGKPDLYDKPLKITFMNVVDDIASAAHLLMGEADELRPLVIVRGVSVEFMEASPSEVLMSEDECLIMSSLRKDLTCREN